MLLAISHLAPLEVVDCPLSFGEGWGEVLDPCRLLEELPVVELEVCGWFLDEPSSEAERERNSKYEKND